MCVDFLKISIKINPRGKKGIKKKERKGRGR
jgi:hypothetical protein